MDRLTHRLEEETQSQLGLQQVSEDCLAQLRGEVDGLRAEQERAEQQKELLDRTGEEQRAEIVRLRLAVSELELERENLLFQSSSHEGTVGSLKSQVWLPSHTPSSPVKPHPYLPHLPLRHSLDLTLLSLSNLPLMQLLFPS